MNPIVYFNGYLIDLVAGQTIAQTKQVNDIANLDKRQANYSNRFKGADTANNRKAFEFLSLPGNKSNVPYQRNTAYLYSHTGECFVYKGWANVTSTSDGYDIIIYDGAIDIYKAIENKSLSDLGLSELNHTKSLAAVMASWDEASPYKYILGDYGGKLYYGDGIINIDYLVPSVNTKWLWNKLFDFHGFTYSGSIFDTEDFINHWMTFPKGVFATLPDEEKFESTDAEFEKDPLINGGITITPNSRSRYMKYNSSTLTGATLVDDRHIVFDEPGTYRVQITADIRIHHPIGLPMPANFNIAKNCQGVPLSKNISVFQTKAIVGSTVDALIPVDLNFIVQAGQFESICFFIKAQYDNIGSVEFTSPSITVSKVVSSDISFENALSEFSQRDFLKETLADFGLTPFKDQYTNHIEFLTLQERLQNPEVDDWSDKFVWIEGETYNFGNYAQRNIFSFNYNDKESSYNDGELLIDNVNLEDAKTVIKSKIYSPERDQVQYLGRLTNTYKLFEKEITDSENVTYKPLDKRFHFLKALDFTFDETTIGSETLETTDTITAAPVESFFRMRYNDRIADYYAPMQAILNKSLVQTIKLHLNDQDVVGLDFRKLKYIEQESSYYILNKLVNYIPGKTVKAEMIRVFYSPPETAFTGIRINSLSIRANVEDEPVTYGVQFAYTNATGENPVYMILNGVESIVIPTLSYGNSHMKLLTPLDAGDYELTLRVGDLYSNTKTWTLE